MLNYPAFRFRGSNESVVVLNKEEDESLGDGWLDRLPEDFDIKAKMPTYRGVEFVVNPVDVEEIAKDLDKPRNKPGPKPKAK